MIYLELSQGSNTAYISVDGIIKNNRWYDVGILSINSMTHSRDGGYIRTGDCSIVLNKEVVKNAGLNINNRVFDCKIWLVNGDVGLFWGKAILIDDDEISITLLLKSDEYEQNLLDAATDLNDITNRVYYRAFGKVEYVEPLLLDDVNLIYHKGYITGTLGTDWHVYDDGVNIDSNVTDNGDGTFTLSASPVGTVTISQTTTSATLISVVDFIASRLGFTLESTLADNVAINYFVNSQINCIDFLKNVCEFANHIFFIDKFNSKLVLVQLYDDFTSIPSDIKIQKDGFSILRNGCGKSYNQITKQFKATWEKRTSISNPQSVKSEQVSVIANTGDTVGQILDVNVYDYYADSITDVLTKKVNLYKLHQVELKLPDICLTYNDIGKVIYIDLPDYVDTTKDNWMQIVEIENDFENAETTVRGHGELYWK